MKRSGPPKRKAKPPTADRDAIAAWRWAAWERTPMRGMTHICPVSGQALSWGRDEAHHPIERATLKARGLPEFDPRNGVFVKRRVHERHTLAVERIPFAALPECVVEYAAELGPWAEDLLRRYHP